MYESIPEKPETLEQFPEIIARKFKITIKQSKKGKASGPDHISINLIEII